MRRTAFAAVLLAASFAVGACGSADDSASGPSSSSAPVTTAASSASHDCGTQPWPRELPDFRGKPLGETVVGAALCFDVTAITTADGRDVMHDPAAATTPWTVTAQQPDPGASVAADTPVTLTVEAPR
ncbi:PASTA domain-containing protein [Nocardia veterana]|uniref:PASTA domain-containing protein n=1 Tax=Nocardia veterana TaxID=132249 RepID=A0A7X6RH58_9NOCA|nr:hypothetical protein [Nocardia veterana]NKY85268.1 hypothetical protein [Nocardia veterana]